MGAEVTRKTDSQGEWAGAGDVPAAASAQMQPVKAAQWSSHFAAHIPSRRLSVSTVCLLSEGEKLHLRYQLLPHGYNKRPGKNNSNEEGHVLGCRQVESRALCFREALVGRP